MSLVEATFRNPDSTIEQSEKSLSKNVGRKIFEPCFRETFFATSIFATINFPIKRLICYRGSNAYHPFNRDYTGLTRSFR
jgi:hypothetical protein